MSPRKSNAPYFIYVRLGYKWRWACTSYGVDISRVKEEAANYLLHYYGGATGVKITRKRINCRGKNG